MLVPILWMNDYVDIDKSDREIADRVTETGSHVESIDKYEGNLENVVVGQILEMEKAQELKNLMVCKVDTGDEVITLLTGAKNMSLGDKVIVAKLGAILPGNFEIKEQKFGDHISRGMLCSYEELGFNDSIVPKNSRNGIAILSSEVKVGENIKDTLDLDYSIIDIELTPNRGDCLSITGMGREVSASFYEKLEMPENNLENLDEDINDYIDSIEIKSDKCKTFIGRLIKDVDIKDSPQWIQNRLMQAGIRPINNIVDLGNFVMLEYGQPLHVYDYDKIKGRKVIIRDAKENETLITLDEKKRTLDTDTLLIANEDEGMCIAGIMGGLDSEVTENTKNVFLEAAVFMPSNIRKTSKKLNLASESSQRNEKGANVLFAEEASKRFAYLCQKENIGSPVNGAIRVGETKGEKRTIDLRLSRCNMLIGREFTMDEVVKNLSALELEVTVHDEDKLTAKIPLFRNDLSIEADLIEEIVRLFGIHNVTPKPLTLDTFPGRKTNIREFKDKTMETLYALGLSEILTYSFISPKGYEQIRLKEDSKLNNPVKIFNPLGEDFSVMRTTLIPEMMDVIHKNINNRIDDIRFYEVANTFEKTDELPKEIIKASIGLSGNYDYYYINDLVSKLLEKLHVKNFKYVRNSENPTFHPGRCASIMIDGDEIGVIGQIHPLVQENFNISQEVYVAELNVNKLFNYHIEDIKYTPIIKYPPIERDISLVINRDIESKDIEDVIKEFGGEYLMEIELFDIYTGKQIGDDKKSYAYNLIFKAKDRTLKDEEIDIDFNNIVKGLKDKFNVDLRS